MDHRATDHGVLMATPAYRELMQRRRRLVWSSSTILFGLLMALTALTVFTQTLDGQIVPGLSGAILASYVVFFAPVVFAHRYVARVRDLDELAQQAHGQAQVQSERTGAV